MASKVSRQLLTVNIVACSDNIWRHFSVKRAASQCQLTPRSQRHYWRAERGDYWEYYGAFAIWYDIMRRLSASALSHRLLSATTASGRLHLSFISRQVDFDFTYPLCISRWLSNSFQESATRGRIIKSILSTLDFPEMKCQHIIILLSPLAGYGYSIS